MAAKKKNAKNPPKIGWRERRWLDQLPQQILELLPTYRKTRRNTLHYLDAPGVIKSLAGPILTTRCCREPPLRPLLRRADKSATLKYFPSECPFTTERVARVNADIMHYHIYHQAHLDEYQRTLAVPFRIRRDPLFQKEYNIGTDLTSKVRLDGKEYAMSLQGILVVVERVDSRATITGVASNRAIPSLSLGWRCFKEHLVELDGEIILILFVHEETIGVVDRVEVYRLMLREIKWIKAERIGGKVLFLDPHRAWVNSAEIGCRGDCIYFTQPSYSGWLVYDMESGSISHL